MAWSASQAPGGCLAQGSPRQASRAAEGLSCALSEDGFICICQIAALASCCTGCSFCFQILAPPRATNYTVASTLYQAFHAAGYSETTLTSQVWLPEIRKACACDV